MQSYKNGHDAQPQTLSRYPQSSPNILLDEEGRAAAHEVNEIVTNETLSNKLQSRRRNHGEHAHRDNGHRDNAFVPNQVTLKLAPPQQKNRNVNHAKLGSRDRKQVIQTNSQNIKSLDRAQQQSLQQDKYSVYQAMNDFQHMQAAKNQKINIQIA